MLKDESGVSRVFTSKGVRITDHIVPGKEQELAWKVGSLVKIQKRLDLQKELERDPQSVLHLTNLRSP